jgi:tryptophanyl-tRNA synthetase
MRAQTDPGSKIAFNPKRKPGVSNLISIYSLFSEKPIKSIEKEFRGKGYAVFKKALAKLLIETLEPLQQKRKELLSREVYIQEILKQGKRKSGLIAKSTMQEVKEKMGLPTS